jgi:heme-degrading monooxygenase HmoA
MHHLAQLNIAKTRYPLDDQGMRDFVDNLEPINQLAEESPGFVWRLKDESGDATSINVFDDASIIVNMSVWDSAESLKAFAYNSHHAAFVKRRREWFERLTESYYVLWWVPAGHIPTVEEAKKRLAHLREKGESPYAFSFRSSYSGVDAAGCAPA